MTDRIQVWVSKSKLATAIKALQELAAYRRSLFRRDEEGYVVYADEAGIDAVRDMERAAEELGQALKWQPPRSTEDEQITDVKALIAELRSEGIRDTIHYASPANTLRSQIQTMRRQRQAAFDAWSTMVDDQRVNMRAVKLMVERALQCDTHRRKNATLYVLLDTIENMVVDLANVDVDEPQYYDHWGTHNASWEFRRILSENRHLQLQVKALEEQIATNHEPEAEPEEEEDGG